MAEAPGNMLGGESMADWSLGSGQLPQKAFLFTDIEASTKRWEADPAQMARALARHDDLLRRAIEGSGGAVFKHTGDGCCAVFDAPAAALDAAVVAQLAVSAEDWGQGGSLRVRMALHAGAAQTRGGDYFGPTLNRTARLLGTAHGGQIVLTLAAKIEARSVLPADVTLRDLGEHRLADLAQPERVFQVVHPALPSTFPALRSTQRHNLPTLLSPFVGRRVELNEVSRLVTTTNLVTLTGVGGAGKTRLALEAAARNRADFADGVFFVDLAPLTDPALVPDRVASALGMVTEGVTGSADLIGRLASYLQDRRVLLLLDNCEHLIEAAATLADAILTGSSGLVVLATSREPLGLTGEVCWPVPPLSLPGPEASEPDDLIAADAVALFCERARAAQPGFALSNDNVAAVVEICRRLDGIPLALELAAARLRLLSAEQIAERLGDRFRLLTGGSRTALPRHQTLQATLDWSYHLLSDPERRLLARFAVFPGGFSFDAAEAVGADGASVRPAAVLDLLGGLVDKSLVSADLQGPEPRYRLLETVAQYAVERLAEFGETEAVGRRHRDFFLGLVDAANANRDLWATDTTRWLRRARTDLDNFRGALDWSSHAGETDAYLRLATALTFCCFLDGRLPEAQGWLERGLRDSPTAPTESKVTALAFVGFLVLFQGDLDRAQSILREANGQAESIKDRNGMAMCGLYLSVGALGSGKFDTAGQLLEDAAREFESLGLNGPLGWTHTNRGWLRMRTGDIAGADAHFSAALAIGRQVRSDDLVAQALGALGSIAAVGGDAERALALADEAVEVARRLQLRLVLVTALTRAGEAAILLGRPDKATSALTEALALLCDAGSRGWGADCLDLSALVLAAAGRPRPAVRCLASAHTIRRSGEQPMGTFSGLATEVEQCRVRLADALGAADFAKDWARGQEFSVYQALRDALLHLDDQTATTTGTIIGRRR